MKKKNLFTLALVFPLLFINFFTNSAHAQPPLPIGDPAFKQKECFDSNPTAGNCSGVGMPTGTITNVFDGDLNTNLTWRYGYSARGFVNVTGFKKPSDNGLTDFNITYIDIKIHYRAHAADWIDDQYRIVFYLGGETVELQSWVAGHNATWPYETDYPRSKAFSGVDKPDGGNWTWTDIANIKIGFESRVVGANNFQFIHLHEIWITAYSTPYPAAGTISIQPPIIWGPAAGDVFFIDVYVTNVTNMYWYQLVIVYNPTALEPTVWHSYNEFLVQDPSDIGPGNISIGYHTYLGDPVGFTGSAPVLRIYFKVNAATDSQLHFEHVQFYDVYGNQFTLTAVDGYYRSEGDSESPRINSVSASPLFPSYQDDVAVEANVTDNMEIDDVTLSYHQLLSEWLNTTMALSAGLFNAIIPSQPYGSHIEYKVYANDTSANSAVSDTYSYTVGDNVKPQITASRSPLQPRASQTTTIMANATEPPSASGVKTVWLQYSVDGQPSPTVEMAFDLQSSLWEASVPGQQAHTVIEYYVFAEDNAGNGNYTETFSYAVALAGDANLDHIVDVVDAAIISAHWHPGPPIGPLGYDSTYDLNNDGVIGIIDGATVSADWNKTW